MSTFQQLIDENWSGVQIAGFVQKNVHSLNSTKQEAMEWNCSVLEAIHNAIDQYDSDHVSALGGLVTVLGMTARYMTQQNEFVPFASNAMEVLVELLDGKYPYEIKVVSLQGCTRILESYQSTVSEIILIRIHKWIGHALVDMQDTWVEMMLPAMEEFVNVSLLQEWPSDEYEKMVVACGTLTVKCVSESTKMVLMELLARLLDTSLPARNNPPSRGEVPCYISGAYMEDIGSQIVSTPQVFKIHDVSSCVAHWWTTLEEWVHIEKLEPSVVQVVALCASHLWYMQVCVEEMDRFHALLLTRLKNPVLKSAQDFEQYDNLILSLREMHLLGTPAPIPAMTMYTALISIVPTMQKALKSLSTDRTLMLECKRLCKSIREDAIQCLIAVMNLDEDFSIHHMDYFLQKIFPCFHDPMILSDAIWIQQHQQSSIPNNTNLISPLCRGLDLHVKYSKSALMNILNTIRRIAYFTNSTIPPLEHYHPLFIKLAHQEELALVAIDACLHLTMKCTTKTFPWMQEFYHELCELALESTFDSEQLYIYEAISTLTSIYGPLPKSVQERWQHFSTLNTETDDAKIIAALVHLTLS